MISFSPKQQRRAFMSNGQPQGSSGRRQKGELPSSCLHSATIVTIALCMLATPAMAEKGEKTQSVPGEAINAATQPLQDLNIRSRKIPDLLIAINGDPYALDGMDDCNLLRGKISQLDDVLGPDADEEKKNGSVVNKALRAGGNVIGGFIPFRGLVREVTGANSQRRKMEVAIYAGVTRRSFLKGYATALQCKSEEERAIQSAEDVLGLSHKTSGSPYDENIITENRDASDTQTIKQIDIPASTSTHNDLENISTSNSLPNN